MGNFIEVINVEKEFKGNKVLNGINLKLESNKIHGFIGRNGCGKTVLFKCIAGLAFPTNGEIRINNKKLEKGDFPKDMGIIIENPGFIPSLTGRDNLKVLARIKNKITDNDIKKAMELVELDYNNKKSVKNYSLGMRQRLGIAQAIMEKPKLLILDEPFNSLDKEGVNKIRKLLLVLKEAGTTILLTSHIQEDIDKLCDNIFEIDNGKIIS